METGKSNVASLVRSARSGDRESQELVARRVYESGMRLAAFSLGDRDLAQDVGQEAALRALRSLGRLRDPERFDAWSYRICIGELKRAAKRRRRQAWEPLEGAVPELGEVPRYPELLAERDWLVPALARLSERQRTVIALRYVYELTDAEISVVIRARRGTVRSLLSRALARLREEAEEVEHEGRIGSNRTGAGLGLVPEMEAPK